jgi:hypothetical protein
MRKPHSNQQRFDCHSVNQVQLNLNCRDEIIPVLRSLQHIYSTPTLRQEILNLVALDVNHDSRHDRGREGLDYWQVLVLAGVRLGCNFDYDKLQDLAEQHRALRHVMGIGDWETQVDFRAHTQWVGGALARSVASPHAKGLTTNSGWKSSIVSCSSKRRVSCVVPKPTANKLLRYLPPSYTWRCKRV